MSWAEIQEQEDDEEEDEELNRMQKTEERGFEKLIRLGKEKKSVVVTQEGLDGEGTEMKGEEIDGDEKKEHNGKEGREGDEGNHPSDEMKEILKKVYEVNPEEWDECTFPLGYAGTCCMIPVATKWIVKETSEDMGESLERG